MAPEPGADKEQTLLMKPPPKAILPPSRFEPDDDAPGAARTELRTVALAPPKDVNFSPDLKRWRQPR